MLPQTRSANCFRIAVFTFVIVFHVVWLETLAGQVAPKEQSCVRFATFNVSFHRKKAGELGSELEKSDSRDPRRIAEIIQRVRPDVLLLNEFDFDAEGKGLANFADNYLAVSQGNQEPIKYEFHFYREVNTGVDSKVDLNGDGETGSPNDAYGFGVYPGQYGMAVLSKYEIDEKRVRTFRNFLWKDMPDGLLPVDPGTEKSFYNDEVKKVFRLSSKSHWDVPVKVDGATIHFLTAHPTPPVFDGPEDRNGRRNHDEIRLFADYVDPAKSGYIYDDDGVKGGLVEGARFVIAGDMNADEHDGDSSMNAADQLTRHPLINHAITPQSEGGPIFANQQAEANLKHKGNPAFDTSDFSDGKVGNLHLDYCLPSKSLDVKQTGVFWPKPDQPGSDLVGATDHRMVWIDVVKPVKDSATK